MPNRRGFTLCGRELSGLRHICCFYDSREQQHDVFAPYLREGLACGEQVVCIFPADRHQELRDRLRREGVDVDAASADGQLGVLSDDETYVTGGMFAKDRMVAMLREVLDKARADGRGFVRTLGEMDWALRNLPGTDDLAEYESSVNELTAAYDCTLACAYDINKFSGRVLMDALCTHSHLVLNGEVHENAYSMSPRDFRKVLAMRPGGPGVVSREAARS